MAAYRKSASNCIVRIIPLYRLTKGQAEQCHALRQEAGRCWTDMLRAQIASRSGKWLSSVDLGKQFKGLYALHSQTIQALAQKLEANIDTAREVRKTNPDMRFPYKEKQYQTVVWKKPAISVQGDAILLSNGNNRAPLSLWLPSEYWNANIRKAELTWRADHYELCITIDTGETNPAVRTGQAAGVDLGEINIAAVVTEQGQGLVISGRALRSVNRLRNKRLAAYQSSIDRCKNGSRRQRKLLRSKARASAKYHRQKRDILHKASRQLVEFCDNNGVGHIAIGDVRDIQNGVSLGTKTNQKISQWAHGQFIGYVGYKARKYGMTTGQIPEDYSTRTCSVCGNVRKNAPHGRVYTCSGCGAVLSRDGNGGANICSRYLCGEYGKVQIHQLMYLRPLRSSAFETGPCCSLSARTSRL